MEHPTTTLIDLECSICGERHDAGRVQTVCRACGRALLARYDLDAAAPAFRRRAYRDRPPDMWRYGEVLPIGDRSAVVTLDVCPEGGATIAALRHLLDDGLLDGDERVVVFNCGSGLKYR